MVLMAFVEPSIPCSLYVQRGSAIGIFNNELKLGIEFFQKKKNSMRRE